MVEDPEIRVKPVETNEELRLANDLMAKSHNQSYYASARWMETFGAGYPGFEREHTRIALRNGELAGALRVHTDTIRIGEARLKMGGLAWVSTAERHRHQGIARTLLSATMDYLQSHGYDVAMLFGIPNFYHRFGFITTLADYYIDVDASEALSAAPDESRVRDAKPGDINALQKLHNDGEENVACSLIRTAAHVTNTWERFKKSKVLTNQSGRVEGYFVSRVREEGLVVLEVGVRNIDMCDTVLEAVGREAVAAPAGLIRFHLPPAHPFARFLLLRNSVHTMKVRRDQDGMMAFVNLEECLEHMIPEWENLLLRAAVSSLRTEATFLVDGRPVRIRSNRGALDVSPATGRNKVSLSSAELMHLLTGYRYLEDVLAAKRRIIDEPGRALLQAMFPKRSPFVWPLDRF